MSEAPTIVDSIYIELGEDAEFAYWEGKVYKFQNQPSYSHTPIFSGQYYEYRLFYNGFFESSENNIIYNWSTRKWQDIGSGDPIGIFSEYNPEYVTLTRSAGGLLGVFQNPYYVASTRQPNTAPETNTDINSSDVPFYIDGLQVEGTFLNPINITFEKLSSNNIYFGTVPGNYIPEGSNFLIGNFTALNRGDDYDTWDNTYLDFNNHGPPNQMLSVGGDAVIQGNLGIGTSSPQYKLDVSGDINFTGTLYQNGFAFSGGGGGGGGSNYFTSGITINASGTGNPAENAIYVYNPTFQSGDAIIAARVNGNGGDPMVTFDIANVLGWSFGIDSTDGGKLKWNNAYASLTNNTKMTLDTSGNLGIGTSTPAYKLDIAGTTGGDALISSHIDNDIILFDDQKSTTTFTGTLSGGTTRDTDDNFIILASSVNQNRTVSWPIHLPNYWTCEFDWFASTTTGADETQFIFYATVPITSVIPVDTNASTASGFSVTFEFFDTDRIVIKNNLGTIVASSDVTFITNSYYKVVITFNRGYLSVSMTLNMFILQLNYDFGEMSQAYTTGKYMGFGGRTGSVSSIQRVRKIKVTKGCPFVHQNNNLSYMNGNLGIGTSSPQYKLDVSGTMNLTSGLRVDGSAGTSGQVLTSSGGGLMTWATVSGGGSSVWSLNGTNAYYNNGNVGIGINSPSAKLTINSTGASNPHINGLYVFNPTSGSGDAIITARVNGTGGDPYLSLDVANQGGWTFGIDSSDAVKLKWGATWDSLTNSTKMTLDRSGNLGIGTTSPSYKLDVSGNINFTGTLYQNGVAFSGGGGGGGSSVWSLNGTAAYYNNGNVGIGTEYPYGKLHVRDYDFYSTTAVFENLTGDATVIIQGNQPFLYFYGTNFGDMFITGFRQDYDVNGFVIDRLYAPTGETFIIASDGNVGIGKTSPTYKLDVSGDINFSGTLYQNGVAFSGGGGGGGSSVWSLNAGGVAYYNSGNVGIGTSIPQYKLDVSGTGRFTGTVTTGNTLQIGTNTNDSVSKTIYFGGLYGDNAYDHCVIENRIYGTGTNEKRELLLFSGNDSGDPDRIRLRAGQICFDTYTGGTGVDRNTESIKMVINSDGNVGIGTVSTSAKLTINSTGTANPGENGIYVYNPTYQSGDAIITARVNGTGGDPFISFDIASVLGWTFGVDSSDAGKLKWSTAWSSLTSATKMTLDTSGNLGIGIITPTGKLHIHEATGIERSATRGTLTIQHGNSGGRSSIVFPSAINYGSDHGFIEYLDSYESGDEKSRLIIGVQNDALDSIQDDLILLPSGAVGIGIVNPSRGKLHIVGSVTPGIGGYAYYNSSADLSARLGIGSTPNPYSLYCDSYIAAQEFNAYSDRRIKKNIVDINDSSALDKIRLLEPKIYNYIDEKNKGTNTVYGFIAQEVANVLPYAVTISEGDIPNILTNSNVVSVTEDNTIIELHLDSTVEGLSLSNTSKINIITSNNKNLTVPVLSFTGSNVITIQNRDEFSNVSGVYIHGENIKDFHHLNKDAIWAVASAALQEVDRQLQTEKTKVATLETQIADLLARVTALES